MDIKAIILDIDGVIVGEKVGINSPSPHPSVINALKRIRRKGIPVCLITAKPYFAIVDIIDGALLNNLHVTDGGSVIINPIDHLVIEKHNIDKKYASQALDLFIRHNIYVEFYTVDDYFVQQSQISHITNTHKHILQREPQIVPSLIAESRKREITKIIPIAKDISGIKVVVDVFKPLSTILNLYWTVHPVALPLQFGIVVPFGISKTEGIKTLATHLHLPFENLLGVGDSTSDWQFMQLCGYTAAMGNASDELKQLVKTKGKYSYIAPSVDENGILDVFKHFGLYSA